MGLMGFHVFAPARLLPSRRCAPVCRVRMKTERNDGTRAPPPRAAVLLDYTAKLGIAAIVPLVGFVFVGSGDLADKLRIVEVPGDSLSAIVIVSLILRQLLLRKKRKHRDD